MVVFWRSPPTNLLVVGLLLDELGFLFHGLSFIDTESSSRALDPDLVVSLRSLGVAAELKTPLCPQISDPKSLDAEAVVDEV